MIRRTFAVALAALMLPAAADAATVHVGTVRDSYFRTYPGFKTESVIYRAGRGERNRVVVAYAESARSVTVSDPGAVVHAGDQCKSLGRHRARCVGLPGLSTSYLQHAEVRLRDRADSVHTTRPTPYPIGGVTAFGGSGNDLLDGGAGSDELIGGSGRDRMLGGALGDNLVDAEPSSGHGKGRPARDVMNGGGGPVDSVTYQHRTRRVTVDLRKGVGGERGERDRIRNVEGATGGSGADRILGDASGNSLSGRGGADVLLGRGDNDGLDGGLGRDRVAGGSGGDTLRPGRGLDSLSCGSGDDRVENPVAGERMSTHCETAVFTGRYGTSRDMGILTLTPNPVATSDSTATFDIPCPEFEQSDGELTPCEGTVDIRETGGAHRLLGHASFPTRTSFDDSTLVKVQLTALGRQLSSRPDGVIATVSVRGDEFPSPNWTIRLRT